MKLPLPDTPKNPVKVAIDGFFKKKLLLERNTFAPSFYLHDSWWVRCSAQIWNEVCVCSTYCNALGLNEYALTIDQRLRIPRQGI